MTAGLLLISGHGRCGTSLLMQMLDAGGYPIAAGAQPPAYERDPDQDPGTVPADASVGDSAWSGATKAVPTRTT